MKWHQDVPHCKTIKFYILLSTSQITLALNASFFSLLKQIKVETKSMTYSVPGVGIQLQTQVLLKLE